MTAPALIKAPDYISLISELVGTLNSMQYFVKDPDLKKTIKKRADELRSITIHDIVVENIASQLHKAKHFTA